MSDGEILGLQDWFGKPPAPTLQVYRKIELPNYVGPDSGPRWPWLTSQSTIRCRCCQRIKWPSVLQSRPAAEVPDDDRVRRQWCSARNDSWPSELETGAEDTKPQANKGRHRRTFWRRTMRFIGRMFCCGAYASDVTDFPVSNKTWTAVWYSDWYTFGNTLTRG